MTTARTSREALLVFDNAGGVTVELIDERGNIYRHTHSDMDSAAADYATFCDEKETYGWDGNEFAEHGRVEVSAQDVANGGYLVFRLNLEVSDMADMIDDLHQPRSDGWSNVEAFRAALLDLR